MTTLNSEEITLSSDSVDWGVHLPLSLNDNTEQWRDNSVLWTCWLGGSICLWVSMTTLNSEEITLCSDSVLQGIYLPLSLIDNIDQWRDNSGSDSVDWGVSVCLWVWMKNIEQWRDHSVLCNVDQEGVHLPLSLNDNIEQWRDHSVLWLCCLGWSICLWISITTLNSEEITLCSDSVLGGPSVFQSQWQPWTVKRSLCALAGFFT